jgi:hypothetical protein
LKTRLAISFQSRQVGRLPDCLPDALATAFDFAAGWAGLRLDSFGCSRGEVFLTPKAAAASFARMRLKANLGMSRRADLGIVGMGIPGCTAGITTFPRQSCAPAMRGRPKPFPALPFWFKQPSRAGRSRSARTESARKRALFLCAFSPLPARGSEDKECLNGPTSNRS